MISYKSQKPKIKNLKQKLISTRRQIWDLQPTTEIDNAIRQKKKSRLTKERAIYSLFKKISKNLRKHSSLVSELG